MKSNKKNELSIRMFDINFTSKSFPELLVFFKHCLSANNEKISIVLTPNPEQIVIAQNDQEFQHILETNKVNLPDGVGLVLASKLISFFKPTNDVIINRTPGVDVASLLTDFALNEKIRVLIIGGRNYAGKKYKQIVKVLSGKSNQISDGYIFWHQGFKNINNKSKLEEKELFKVIKKIQPKIVFAAFGSPYQEKWLSKNETKLEEYGVQIAVSVGGSFDFLLGNVSRAPIIVRKVGFEWLYRLIKQPWRWRRQLRLVKFAQLTFSELFKD